jgi:hypothetical protein
VWAGGRLFRPGFAANRLKTRRELVGEHAVFLDS